MKFSRLGSVTKKQRAENDNMMMELLVQSGQTKLVGAGIYTYGTILLKVRQKLEAFIRQKLEKYDCCEVSLPLLQPKALWENSGRWQKYISNGTMFTSIGKNGEYCIAPTAEEMMFDYVNTIIKSYKDMPLCVFQIGAKFRDEIRVRGGILRSKEFIMKDAYSFHSSKEDLDREYKKMEQCYLEIFNDLGLKAFPVNASSGDMGGKVSEEFMVESSLGEDKILLDEKTGRAFNTEILEDAELFAYYKDKYKDIDFSKLKQLQTIELGHIFQLGQFYSKSMNGVYTNKDGKQDFYEMGCYGIGITRTLGTIIDLYKDQDGLRFPKALEPYTVGIVNLNDEKLNKISENLYNKLQDNGISVMWDDRDFGIGYKIKDLKLLGIRRNIIIGKNCLETGKFEVEIDNKKELMTEKELVSFLKSL